MKLQSKYAQPLQPDRLEQLALAIFSIYRDPANSDTKKRTQCVDQVLSKVRLKQQEHELVFLRAQRLQLDGGPKPTVEGVTPNARQGNYRPPKKAANAPERPTPSQHTKPTNKTPQRSSQTRQTPNGKGSKTTSKPVKKEKLPF